MDSETVSEKDDSSTDSFSSISWLWTTEPAMISVDNDNSTDSFSSISWLWTTTGPAMLSVDNGSSTVSSSTISWLWTTEPVELEAGEPIVTDSLSEQVITVSLLLAFWLYVNLTNGFLLYVMKKVKALETPQSMILASYMVCDMLYCNFQLPIMVPIAISNRLDIMPLKLCRAWMTPTTGFLLTSFHLIGLIGYERYCYFITPLKYTKIFTKVRIYATVTIIYLVSFCISLTVELTATRALKSTHMTCQTTGQDSKISNIFYFTFYFIPCGTVSVITLIRLRLIISKHKAQVAVLPEVISEDQTIVNGLMVKPVKQAIRMVSLVSGSFWLTTMPGAIIRVSLSSAGVTHAVTDYRTSIPLFALSRGSYLLITLVSSILNPIIYIAVLVDLREAVWKCIRLKR